MSEHWRHLAAALLLAGLVVGCYWNSLGNGFTYDDKFVIVQNTMIKDIRNLLHLISKSYFYESTEISYRPLVTLSYFVDYALWGLHPFGFHLTNLLLHLLTTFGVYVLFLRLLPSPRWGEGGGEGPPRPALIGAALFAAHPVLTEAVNNVGYREDLLATGLVLLALCCFHWEGGVWLRAAGLGAYGLALLAKESAIALVLLAPLVDWARSPALPTRRLRRSALPGSPAAMRVLWPNHQRRPHYAGLALVTVCYLAIRFGLMYFPVESTGLWPPLAERLRAWPYATWLHLRLLLLPLNLSADYMLDVGSSGLGPMVLLPGVVMASLLLGLLWLWSRDERLACLGLGWIVAGLGPVANVIPILHPVAERYLYLPAVGFILLLTLALTRLRSQALAVGLAGFLLVAYGALTIQRNPVWRDDLHLWQDTVEKVPASPWIHNNLGVAYEERGDFTQALRQYAWATYLLPSYATAYMNAGWVYLKQGRLALADHYLQQALRLNPHDAVALSRLGMVYYHQGQPERAIPLYRAALAEDPRNAEVHTYLGAAYVATDQQGSALLAFQEALRLNPALAGVHENLGHLYARQGRHAEAQAEAAAARRLAQERP